MHRSFSVVVLMMLASLVQADVYKWVDRNGSVHYGDTPPANARFRSVDLRFAGNATAADVNSCCVAKEDPPKSAEQPVYSVLAAEPPARDPAPGGMDFGVFIMLRHGMSEGELLQRAGPPDYQSTDGYAVQAISVTRRGRPVDQFHGWRGHGALSYGVSNLIVKTFYYYPTISNPFTTVLTLTGGRITDMQRTRQF
ncbi:MAG TPA: DUF4124 domain-containing protein [Burkholderiales bacterium]|nr:DUF4124 domain-containing protein [Burkholderiales bacterium]